MPSTNFPKGVSVSTAQRTTDGEMYAESAVITGLLTVGSIAVGVIGTAGTGFIGQRAVITGTFTSAAGTSWLATPFAGNIVDVITTCDTTPRTCSGLTIQHGTAGSIGVASVALAFATAIGQQIRPTLTPIAVTTASGISIIVTTAGSAANFSCSIVIEKTA
ncbi:MAG: hypothetical protein WC750_06060 [Patescibacteria group bacterium]